MINQILDIKFNNNILTIKKHTQWNFVNIILTIIDNCNQFNSPYAKILKKDKEINFNINLNLDIILNFMIEEIKNTKNNFLNLIIWIFLSSNQRQKLSINQKIQMDSCDYRERLSKLGYTYTQKYKFINRLYKIKNINLCTLLNKISREIDRKGYMYTKIVNKNIIFIINKYVCKWHKLFSSAHWIYEKKYNNIYKKILKKIDYHTVLKSLKNTNKNISGTLKYININNNKIYEILPKIKFIKICTCDHHCMALTVNGDIYAWGSNSFGQLGIDKKGGYINNPTKIAIDNNNKKIINISLGYSFSSIITEDNKLYSCGCSLNGRIGIKNKDSEIYKFTKVNINYNIVKLQSGSMHQCAIDNNNKIYCWGSKYYIGNYYAYNDYYTPNRQIPFFSRSEILIDKISIGQGAYHTLALSISGTVYGWGHNGTLQLGYKTYNKTNHDNDRIQACPIKLKLFSNKYYVKDIICGWSCSYILDYTGNVYVCGRNNEGELGISKSECLLDSEGKYSCYLKKNKNIKNIDKIYNFKESVFFVNFNKNVHSVGNINYKTITPRTLTEPWEIKMINKIKNPIDLSYQDTKKKIYFIK